MNERTTRLAALAFLALAFAVLPLAAQTTLPSYTNAIITSSGAPIQATITVYTAGTTTAATIYSDSAGTLALANPFQTDSLGRFTFYAATGLYDIQVSGATITTYTIEDVALGVIAEDAILTKTETGYGGTWQTSTRRQITQTFTVAPAGEAPTSIYYGRDLTLTIPSTNTYAVGAVQGDNASLYLYGSGVVTSADGMLYTVHNYATTTNIKAGWFYGLNYGPVSGFFYGLQSSISNGAYGPGYDNYVGTIGTATAARLKIDNNTSFVLGTPPNPATITTANIISADISNSITGSGTTLGPTIGTANGFALTWSNGANSTITTSRGIYFATPVNAGTWTNHYGIYLADQTVAGTTANYAIYSGGGTVSFRGPSILGCPTVAPTLENGQITFSVNESTHVLTITVKYSNGTVKTAAVSLI